MKVIDPRTKMQRVNDFYKWLYEVVKSEKIISGSEFERIKEKL